MSHLNVEIKARCNRVGEVREILCRHNAEFRGLDRQVDTYFRSPSGRLKLREGNIETSLIHYSRANQAGPRQAVVSLYHPPAGQTAALKEVLIAAMGVQVVVDKSREIYFIGNVKFHLDQVQGLGEFVEVEAISADGRIPAEELRKQCDRYIQLLGISPADLLTDSYSDMLMMD